MTLDIGLSLGSETLSLCLPDGAIVEEASVVAKEVVSDLIVAVGNEAKNVLRTRSQGLIAVRPVRYGAIAEHEPALALLRGCLDKAVKASSFRVVAAIPCCSSRVEEDALRRVLGPIGAREIHLVEIPMLAAIGAGLPVQGSRATGVIHCGEEMTEIALIALSGIVYCRRIHIGTNEFDDAIVQYLKLAHQCVIGERTAEEIRHKIGTAFPIEKELSMLVNGCDCVTGLVKRQTITSREVNEALLEPIATIVDSIQVTIAKCPIELNSDLAECGFVLTGIGALLPGIADCLALEIGLPFQLAKRPLSAVIEGTRKAFSILEHKPTRKFL